MKVQDVYQSSTVRIDTPAGTLFLIVLEDDNHRPCKVNIHIGKVGSELGTWTQALAGVINIALDHGADLYEIITTISNITSDKLRRHGEIDVRSGVDGVSIALLKYMQERNKPVNNRHLKPWFRRK